MTNRYVIAMLLAAAVLLAGCGGNATPTATPKPPPAPTVAPSAVPPTIAPTQVPPMATDVPPPTPMPTATATRTPTPLVALAATEFPTPNNACATFAGALEIQILVGPAEAVGLEPLAVGSVPIAAIDGAAPGAIYGQGPIHYDATLTKAWGTYQVTMDLEFAIKGTCSGETGQEILDLTIVMSGNQHVSVKATGFSGEYPWEGTHTREVILPMEEGASAFGEGWGVVLHVVR